MERAYIANLKYGSTRWRVWFMAEDSKEIYNKWREAHHKLNDVGDASISSDDFYQKALKLFESYGFIHVQG